MVVVWRVAAARRGMAADQPVKLKMPLFFASGRGRVGGAGQTDGRTDGRTMKSAEGTQIDGLSFSSPVAAAVDFVCRDGIGGRVRN